MSSDTREIKPHLPLHEYTIGWISALPIEHAAAAELLDEEHESPPTKDSDPTLYTLGRISDHSVVIACLPAGEIGIANAATVATHLVDRFPSAKIGLMVGIGGGVPSDDNDIRLGDVVVSQPGDGNGGVVQYDFGKLITGGGFRRTGHLNTPPRLLLNALSKARSNHDRERSSFPIYLATLEKKSKFNRRKAGPDQLFESTYPHAGGSTCAPCNVNQVTDREERDEDELVKIHYGTIASGNSVVKDVVERDQISKELGGKILCFEMEAAGLMNSFPCLVIRDICDYADSHKNKKWQPYAAATAAAYAEELLSVLPPREVAGLAPIYAPWLVPFSRNPQFTGRDEILQSLRHCLKDAERHPFVAVHGLGGSGKSAVAIEFAYQARLVDPSRAVYWVSAFTTTSFKESYREVARRLQIPGADDPENDMLDPVRRKLSGEDEGKWLMIVDNVDDKSVLFERDATKPDDRPLRDYLPHSRYGAVLCTTRSRSIAVGLAPDDHYLLDKMTSSQAEELVRKSLQHKPTLYTEDVVGEFLTLLTFHPLAIIQALAFIKTNNTPLKQYLKLLQDTDRSLLELLEKDFDDMNRASASRNALIATWLVSFQQIQRDNHLAAEFLSFVACIAPQNVPRTILPPAPSEIAQEEAIGTLTGYAFLTERTEMDHYDVHPLIHRVTQHWLKETKRWTQTIRAAVTQLIELVPDGGHEGLKSYPPYLPHALFTVGISGIVDDRAAVNLLYRIGCRHGSMGDYTNAVSTFHRVFERSNRTLGSGHVDTLVTMNQLGVALSFRGDYGEAEDILRRAMALCEEFLGPEHPMTLTSQINLASTYWNQGRWNDAEKLQVQVLETSLRVLGAEHPDTLASLNILLHWRETTG